MNSEFMAMDIKAGIQYLSKIDPDMKQLIDYFGTISLNDDDSDYYESLVKSIIYQQLNGKVANAIYQRFRNLYPHNSIIDPQNVYQTPLKTLRSIGLSERKATYIQGLSHKWISDEIEWNRFACMSNEEIGLVLKTVKGIGQWTVDMFLIFVLARPNVLPVGDLGIQNALSRMHGLKGRPTPERMFELTDAWQPYRSIGSWYLWRSLDTDLF